MRFSTVVAGLTAAGSVAAMPASSPQHQRRQDEDPTPAPHPNPVPVGPNPFEGRKLTANPDWAAKTRTALSYYESRGDKEHAAVVRAVQQTGTFTWVSNRASLPNIDRAIQAARNERGRTGKEQIVGLVLYNLPDRDCSAGESAGELDSKNNGMRLYRETYIRPWAQKLAAARDLTFAVVLEPDSLANLVTNMGVPFCAQAAPVYREGIAHAIAALQLDHVHLYLDAAHGGWLGWDDNLAPTAKEFRTVLDLAIKETGNNGTRVRGFSTNVSNYNPFRANPRENFTEWSNSWDEDHYARSLSVHLEAEGLPPRFIIDQGRVAEPGARKEWGEWCNVAPAGFGMAPGTPVDNELVDSIVWIKPGGESDGRCGYAGAPAAGVWFENYFRLLVEHAHESVGAVARKLRLM